ncbi:MAG TPA: hypothetical protein VMR52_07945 [Dehalococcoidia bacterium]|nr:hypothetical protein [Dehalococcoidia bacterium]
MVRSGAATEPEVRRLLLESGEFREGDVPSENTLRDMVKETLGRLPVGYEYWAAPWSFADEGEAADAALMLSMLTEMIDDSAGSYPRISRGLARWMVRVRRAAAPGLPAGNISHFATLYLRREWTGESTDDLDAFLAFAPWRSERATWVYQQACKQKKVRPLIGLMGLHPSAWPGAEKEKAE